MEELNGIAKLLGEDNEKRLKDTLTDMILENIQEDLKHVYLIDLDELLDEIADEIRAEIKADIKTKIFNKYLEAAGSKVDEMIAAL